MSKSTKKTVFILIILVLIVVFGAAVNKNFVRKNPPNQAKANSVDGAKSNQDQITSEAIKNGDIKAMANSEKLYKPIATDLILGDKSAPVVFIEYASLSCPHCATFHSEAMPKLKADYIETGKVQFIHRDFPLNQPALVASMIAVCNARDNKQNEVNQYYDFLKALFRTQEVWAFVPNFAEKLEAIAKLDGMSDDRFKSCISDSKLQESILTSRLEAAKLLNIQSTPTFIINGQNVSGYTGWENIKKIVDKKLAASSK